MYLRAAHAELYVPALRQFIRDNPLGILTTAIPSKIYPLLQSSHVPWVLDVADDSSETELGGLRGHMARANPHSKAMMDSITERTQSIDSDGKGSPCQLEQEVLILFNGPVEHYVTPKFYTTTKPETGKVVPTWNYSAVQAYGTATVYFDSKSTATSSYLSKQIDDLTKQQEGAMATTIHDSGRTDTSTEQWKVSDAPEKYTELLMKAIIGIEVKITSLGGKYKMSQELKEGDREGVIKGFESLGTNAGLKIAQTVKQRGNMLSGSPLPTLKIRDATATDAEAIAHIGSTVFAKTFGHSLERHDLDAYLEDSYSTRKISEELVDSTTQFIVACLPSKDNQVVGFAQLTKGTTEPCIPLDVASSAVEFQRLYVHLDHHGSGVGKLLTARIEELSRSQGFKTLWLGVWEENVKAQKIYQKVGFKKIGDHEFKTGGCVQTDWIMSKSL